MPGADGMKFHYLDHDSDFVNEAPPVQNTWYEVFHDYDVRLLYCVAFQSNDEVAAKDIEVRWTIDGNVYFVALNAAAASANYIFRSYAASGGGTAGLDNSTGISHGVKYAGKRGQDFKVEVRLTDALGTNQVLRCWCVRETMDLT